VEGQTYSFYSMATDNAGLVQQNAEAVQTTTVSELNKPKIAAKPSASSIAASSPLSVAVMVKGYTGYAAPTGSVTLTSGKYKSAPFKLTNSAATIKVPKFSLEGGKDTLTITYTPDTVGYRVYQSATGTTTVTVAKVKQTIAFAAPKSPVAYGVKPIALSAIASSHLAVKFSVVSGPAKIEGGHTLQITGAGTVVVEASQSGDGQYGAATPIRRTILVNKAMLTVKANNLTMVKGAKVPTLTYKMSGFVNEDTQKSATSGAPVLTTTATSSSPAGAYPITVKQGTLLAKNYAFTLVPGTLTIASK